jgi:hypothetical protein
MSAELEKRLQDALSEALGLTEQNDLGKCQSHDLAAAVTAAEGLRDFLRGLCDGA